MDPNGSDERPPRSREPTIKSINLTTGEVVETYKEHDEATVDARLGTAWDRFESWRETPIS